MAAHKQRGPWELRAKIYIVAIVSLIALSLAGCALSGTQAAATPAVMANLSPPSITVKAGHTQPFTASISGSSNTAVTWSATGGSITASGMYTAPPTAGSYVVKATSMADHTVAASAAVTVTAGVVVSISPASASILTNGTQQFTATVTGSSNTAVTWGATGGSISSSGLYTPPPNTTGAFRVFATSVADTTEQTSVIVNVAAVPVVSVTISPTSASMLTGATQQFTATVTGSSNTAVTWSATSGSVSSSGLYAAPTAAGTSTVKATSAADNSKSASATVIISPTALGAPPEFAVTTLADNVTHFYSNYTATDATHYSIEDSIVKAALADLGNGQWQLDILAKRDLVRVCFPWQTQRSPLSADSSDDIVYYPYILGMSEKATARNVDWTWWGLPYPGTAFAPLVVMADGTTAKIVAATNWPPKAVSALYAAQRMILQYEDTIAANSHATYRALITTVSAGSVPDTLPWQLALDRYRVWLDSVVPPVDYPAWMWNGQGFLNIQLENSFTFQIADINNIWTATKNLYPWVLFWGQMSSYGGGCCELSQTIHGRYEPDLINFVRNSVAGNQYRAGYYSAPYYGTAPSDPPRMLDTQSGLNWLASWVAANQSFGANSYYIDTLARQSYGDPAKVMAIFTSGGIPKDSLLEGVVDIYPAAGLVSGALVGDSLRCGAPGKTPENTTTTMFPRFGRYLLGERLMYSGESNTDWRFWGGNRGWQLTSDGGLNNACDYPAYCNTNGPCEYWTEIQSFLLGTKLDVMHTDNDPVLDAINQERQRVNWWGRRPVYLDTKGLDLSRIPPNYRVELRRFQDINGVQLIAISNPGLAAGLTYGFDNRTFSIPAQRVAVMEIFIAK